MPVAVACAAQMMNAINIGACPLMVPGIAAALGGGTSSLSWVVSAYAIVFGALVLWGGRLTDAVGSRRILVIGFMVSAAGAALAAAAPAMWVLIGGRIVQGIGAALAVPGGLAWLAVSTTDPRRRSRRLAAFAASGAIGFGVGALAGGVLSDAAGWRSVFVLEFIVVVILSLLAWRLPSVTGPSKPAPSYWGAVLTSTALLLFALWLALGSRAGWGGISALTVMALAGALWVGAAVHERRSTRPMIPHHLWRVPGLVGVLLATGLLYAAWAGSYYFGALALQELVGLSMTSAALWLAPLAVGALLGSRVAARALSSGQSRDSLIIAGGAVCALGPLAASYLSAGSHAVLYLLVLLLAIVGQVVAFVAQSDLVVTLVGVDSAGIGGAMFNSAGQIGGGLGLAGLALVFDASTGGALGRVGLASYPGAFRVSALLALLATAAMVVIRFRARRQGSLSEASTSKMNPGSMTDSEV
ncbi:putative MFS family arabinose efflux permease [Rhodococcus sp. SMB37]|uniref:MFS transporter n=1 Tax=Rhodococcus sp. SMB37 TaxID=2512213 RepID=UPI001050B375|nr:MFS transporter [Rhodococcus sp. SMB37]TCN53425.1 putative MFS family arabinose efflux permease [Rhodococcus sp. SMB37]